MRVRPRTLATAVLSAVGTSLTPIAYAQGGAGVSGTESLLEQEMEWLHAESQVTIATGIAQPIYRAPAIATVITAEDIEAMGITELDEALETVPGLHVARNGSQGYGAIYTIRGIYSDYNPETLVLINGIPMTTSLTGGRGPLWAGMPVNNIARIEVIRGPGSAIYGADAFSGVINVITKKAEDIGGTEVGVRAGSFDTQEVWALHGSQWHGFDVALAFEYYTTDGQKKRIDADLQSALDDLFFTDASHAPGPVNLSVDRLDASLDIARGEWSARIGYQGRSNFGGGVGASQVLDPDARFSYDRIIADLTYRDPLFTDDWDVMAQLSYLDTGFDTETNQTAFPPGAIYPAPPYPLLPAGYISNNGTAEDHYRLNLAAIYSGIEAHLVRIGAGAHYADLHHVRHETNLDPVTGLPLGQLIDLSGTPYAWTREESRTNRFLSLQDVWAISNRWELTSGIRLDDYSDVGSTTNPRLALVWQTNPSLVTKFLYGRAFRAPSFVELYNDNNLVTLGNTDLEPETIDTFEVAFDYRASPNLHTTLNLFRYSIEDKVQFVQFVPDPTNPANTAYRAQNVGQQTGHGFELETQWRASDTVTWSANYAYQDSTDEETGADAGNAPHHQVYVRSDWRLAEQWLLNTQLNHVADRERVANDPRPDIDDYTLVDMTLHYSDRGNRWGISMAVRNLFDDDAREPSPGPNPSTGGLVAIPNDLPLAGRNYYASFQYHF